MTDGAPEVYLYIDRTDRIAAIEEAGKQLLLLRPRRFAKSLWLSTLENHYDLAKADQSHRLYLSDHPVQRHRLHHGLGDRHRPRLLRPVPDGVDPTLVSSAAICP